MRASSSSAEAPNLLALAPPASFATSSTQVVLGRRSATEKLAGFIIDMIEGRDADDIAALPMQRNEIADYLGLTFETVSRALRVLKEDGVIRVPSVSQIEVLNQSARQTSSSRAREN